MTDSSSEGRGDRVKLFTLPEANALIPWVREVVERLIKAKENLDAVQVSLSRLTPQMRGNGHRVDALTFERELDRLMATLAEEIFALEQAGIQLKDLQAGIIDFPALHRGRIVLLCWRRGEGDIAFWHELSSGFAGRRPISEFDAR